MINYHELRRRTITYTKNELEGILGAKEASRIELTEITQDALRAELGGALALIL